MAERGAQPQRGVPGERAQADDDAQVGELLELGHRPRQARVALLGRGLVGRRRAAHGGRDPGVVQPQAVVAVHRRRLVGEARAVHGGEQPVARAVAGEHAPGAVAAVGGGRQAEDQHARGRVAEARARGRPQYSSAANDARFSRATCSRHATSRGQRRHATTSASMRRQAGSRHARWSTPSISRVITGSSASTSAGRPVRRLRETSSTEAPMIAKASSGEAKVGAWYCGAARWLSR